MKTKTTAVNSQKKTATGPKAQGQNHEHPGIDYDLPASCALAAERLNHGIEALDRALGHALEFLLRGQAESQRRTAAMLPLDAKVGAMFKLLRQHPHKTERKLHYELTFAFFAVEAASQFRLEFAVSGRIDRGADFDRVAGGMICGALKIQEAMLKVFPECIVGTGSASQPPVVNVPPGEVRAVVPNWARRARERTNPVAGVSRQEFSEATPTVDSGSCQPAAALGKQSSVNSDSQSYNPAPEPPSLGQTPSEQAGNVLTN